MNSEYIPYDEVVHQGLSFTDDCLFEWNGELLRGIPPARASFCRYLFDKGIMQELVAKQLFVETEITTLRMDHCEIVLKHRTIPFVSYPQEWCDIMLKDAALHHLHFCMELHRHKLLSEDAHPLNILFDGCQPIFVDYGSIAPIPADGTHWEWFSYEQFGRAFVYPLRLMAQGHGRIARWLLHDYELGVLKSDLEALTRRPLPGLNAARNLVNRFKYQARLHVPERIRNGVAEFLMTGKSNAPAPLHLMQAKRGFFRQILKEVESIKLPSAQPGTTDVSDGSRLRELPSEDWTSTLRTLSNVLSDLRPGSVLDIGRDTHGVDIPLLAARHGSRVVAVNRDETTIRDVYAVARSNNLPIIPLLIDFFSPSYDLSNYWFTAASKRLRCDLVLAMDLVHHLVKENIRFNLIVERLSTLSNRWLVVEFVPLEDRESCEMKAAQYSWYTIDTLRDELMKCFRSINILSSESESRVLLLCEK